MKYQVGDKVTIRPDLAEAGERGDFDDHLGYDDIMGSYAGKEVTISTVIESRNAYFIKEDNSRWYWSDDMLSSEAEVEPTKKEENKMEVKHEAVELINESDIIQKGYDTLNLCDIYHPTDYGMNAIYREWAKQKGESPIWNGHSLLDILSKHPDYVPEKGYIVKKAEYDRPVDFGVTKEVIYDIYSNSPLLREEVNLYPFSYREICASIIRLSEVINGFENIYKCMTYCTYKGMSYEEVYDELARWKDKRSKIRNNSKDYFLIDDTVYTRESENKRQAFSNIFERLINWVDSEHTKSRKDDAPLVMELVIDEELANFITEAGIKGIRAGQKLNKVVGKILTHFDFIRRWAGYNRQIARLGDATSPKRYTKYTIVSANMVDFWRMSFGQNWSSCQTIDKEGNFHASSGGSSYEGMHGSGTMSYMLDNSTLIMYTVDENYTGSDYEMEPKINRCMFHVGEGKFVMGRVYPQGTDGAKEVYKQWRTIFQTIMSECMDVPNYWKTQYNRSEKMAHIRSRGTHYCDYEYAYCDIAGWSWNKPDTDSVPSTEKIVIGHFPICPSCGCTHEVENNIECESCNSNSEYIETCESCGCRIDREVDEYYTNENGNRFWCCLSCASDDGYYLPEDDESGVVYRESELYYEESTNTYWISAYDSVEAGGNWYHNAYAAESDGWEFFPEDNEWYREDDFEEDAITGERFPYHANPDEYFTTDGEYFINEDNLNQYIADNAA